MLKNVDFSESEKDQVPHVKSETTIDIPSKGIHKTFEKEAQGGLDYTSRQQRRDGSVTNSMEKLNSYAGAGIEYSPLDMAEYVFWTGDEKGVTLAIEEFLEEGIMSKEEAINFLQSIKSNLDYMQAHYQGLHNIEDKITNKILEGRTNQDKALSSRDYGEQQMQDGASRPSLYGLSRGRQQQYADKKKRVDPSSDENYEQLLERLRVADFLYTEYSLEEVIYQLAKVMFSQSLTRGSREAEMALHRFTGFLEREADNGQISRALEKKILDVLIAALADTLAEHPELLSTAREGLANLGGNVAQLLQDSTASSQGMPSLKTPKLQAAVPNKNM